MQIVPVPLYRVFYQFPNDCMHARSRQTTLTANETDNVSRTCAVCIATISTIPVSQLGVELAMFKMPPVFQFRRKLKLNTTFVSNRVVFFQYRDVRRKKKAHTVVWGNIYSPVSLQLTTECWNRRQKVSHNNICVWQGIPRRILSAWECNRFRVVQHICIIDTSDTVQQTAEQKTLPLFGNGHKLQVSFDCHQS
jgi:hypothetical protein